MTVLRCIERTSLFFPILFPVCAFIFFNIEIYTFKEYIFNLYQRRPCCHWILCSIKIIICLWLSELSPPSRPRNDLLPTRGGTTLPQYCCLICLCVWFWNPRAPWRQGARGGGTFLYNQLIRNSFFFKGVVRQETRVWKNVSMELSRICTQSPMFFRSI